jgi:RNA recognition motif-containing protein
MPTKLYIGNIPPSASSTELTELFEKYGKVLECDIIKDYAFVVSFCKNKKIFYFFLVAYGRRKQSQSIYSCFE